jgi:hypothetical protein
MFGGPDGGPDPSCSIALVVSDRPDVGALDRAELAGVPRAIVRPKEYEGREAFGQALLDVLGAHDIDVIALAGYLKLLPENVVGAFRGKIINIHPGPLPTFGGSGMWGHHVHEAVLDSGVAVSGPTIHFVDERCYPAIPPTRSPPASSSTSIGSIRPYSALSPAARSSNCPTAGCGRAVSLPEISDFS